MAEKLGAILVRKGLLSQAQLDEALKAQLIYGGRLGSILVELEMLDIDTLAMVLGEQTRYPVAQEADFEAVTDATLTLLPAALAEKHLAFPLGQEGRRLRVAMASPFEIQHTDALGFITGLRILPHITPELRLFHYQAQRYGIRRESRSLSMATARRLAPAPPPRPAAPPVQTRGGVVEQPESPPPPAPVRAAPGTEGMFGGLAPGQFLSDDSDDATTEETPWTGASPVLAPTGGLLGDASEAPAAVVTKSGPPVLGPAASARPPGPPQLASVDAARGARPSGPPPRLAPAEPPRLAPAIPPAPIEEAEEIEPEEEFEAAEEIEPTEELDVVDTEEVLEGVMEEVVETPAPRSPVLAGNPEGQGGQSAQPPGMVSRQSAGQWSPVQPPGLARAAGPGGAGLPPVRGPGAGGAPVEPQAPVSPAMAARPPSAPGGVVEAAASGPQGGIPSGMGAAARPSAAAGGIAEPAVATQGAVPLGPVAGPGARPQPGLGAPVVAPSAAPQGAKPPASPGWGPAAAPGARPPPNTGAPGGPGAVPPGLASARPSGVGIPVVSGAQGPVPPGMSGARPPSSAGTAVVPGPVPPGMPGGPGPLGPPGMPGARPPSSSGVPSVQGAVPPRAPGGGPVAGGPGGPPGMMGARPPSSSGMPSVQGGPPVPGGPGAGGQGLPPGMVARPAQGVGGPPPGPGAPPMPGAAPAPGSMGGPGSAPPGMMNARPPSGPVPPGMTGARPPSRTGVPTVPGPVPPGMGPRPPQGAGGPGPQGPVPPGGAGTRPSNPGMPSMGAPQGPVPPGMSGARPPSGTGFPTVPGPPHGAMPPGMQGGRPPSMSGGPGAPPPPGTVRPPQPMGGMTPEVGGAAPRPSMGPQPPPGMKGIAAPQPPGMAPRGAPPHAAASSVPSSIGPATPSVGDVSQAPPSALDARVESESGPEILSTEDSQSASGPDASVAGAVLDGGALEVSSEVLSAREGSQAQASDGSEVSAVREGGAPGVPQAGHSALDDGPAKAADASEVSSVREADARDVSPAALGALDDGPAQVAGLASSNTQGLDDAAAAASPPTASGSAPALNVEAASDLTRGDVSGEELPPGERAAEKSPQATTSDVSGSPWSEGDAGARTEPAPSGEVASHETVAQHPEPLSGAQTHLAQPRVADERIEARDNAQVDGVEPASSHEAGATSRAAHPLEGEGAAATTDVPVPAQLEEHVAPADKDAAASSSEDAEAVRLSTPEDVGEGAVVAPSTTGSDVPTLDGAAPADVETVSDVALASVIASAPFAVESQTAQGSSLQTVEVDSSAAASDRAPSARPVAEGVSGADGRITGQDASPLDDWGDVAQPESKVTGASVDVEPAAREARTTPEERRAVDESSQTVARSSSEVSTLEPSVDAPSISAQSDDSAAPEVPLTSTTGSAARALQTAALSNDATETRNAETSSAPEVQSSSAVAYLDETEVKPHSEVPSSPEVPEAEHSGAAASDSTEAPSVEHWKLMKATLGDASPVAQDTPASAIDSGASSSVPVEGDVGETLTLEAAGTMLASHGESSGSATVASAPVDPPSPSPHSGAEVIALREPQVPDAEPTPSAPPPRPVPQRRAAIELDELPAADDAPMQLASTWEFVGWQGAEGNGTIGHSAENTWEDRAVDLEGNARPAAPAGATTELPLASAWDFIQQPWQPQARAPSEALTTLLAAADESTPDASPDGPRVSADQVLTALDDVGSQGVLGKVLIAYCAGRFQRAFLLGESFGLVRVGHAWGPGSDSPAVASLKVDLEAPSLLVSALGQLGPSSFDAPSCVQDEAIFAALGGPTSHLLVVPIRARGRPVAFVVADSGGAQVATTTLDELTRVSAKASEVYDRLPATRAD
ncbi:hypothetical protein ACJ2CR_09790 [Myxococcus faecalis]|uniref:GspE/PulE/PilB domain-containing protein n=1 Tax=Myxococcus faecalis TaxID=3115646 RepID=UPI0038CFC2E7